MFPESYDTKPLSFWSLLAYFVVAFLAFAHQLFQSVKKAGCTWQSLSSSIFAIVSAYRWVNTLARTLVLDRMRTSRMLAEEHAVACALEPGRPASSWTALSMFSAASESASCGSLAPLHRPLKSRNMLHARSANCLTLVRRARLSSGSISCSDNGLAYSCFR